MLKQGSEDERGSIPYSSLLPHPLIPLHLGRQKIRLLRSGSRQSVESVVTFRDDLQIPAQLGGIAGKFEQSLIGAVRQVEDPRS